MTLLPTFTDEGVMVLNCPDCTEPESPMVGVDGRWICKRSQHTRQMEPLDEAILEERLEWERFESLVDQFILDTSKEAKLAMADQMTAHMRRGKYLATVISCQGGDYWGSWWA